MTVNEDLVEFLAGSQVFKELPRDALEAIAGVVSPQVVPPKSIIVKEGEPGDCLYIIRSGSVRIFRKSKEGFKLDISIKGPGETIGEMALITGEPRSADVEAIEETQLMVLSKENLDLIMGDFPGISKLFAREMRRWLVIDEKRLEVQAREAQKSSRMTWFDFFLVIGISTVLALIFNSSNPNGIPLFPEIPARNSVPSISLPAAQEEFEKGETLFLDARPTNFYQKRHIKGAVNIPLAMFDFVYLMTLPKDKEKKIIIYEETISKFYDLELAEKLILRGYKQVRILGGGLSAWARKGYPVDEKVKE